jgi:hypothetical protein
VIDPSGFTVCSLKMYWKESPMLSIWPFTV